MSRSSSLAALLQLSDSALPIGRFAHSHGLEALLADDPGADERAIVELVETAVRESVGPLDGVATACAHSARTLDELVELDRLVTAHKLTPGARVASAACGRGLAVLAPELTDGEPIVSFAEAVGARRTDGNLAAVLGALAAGLGLSAEEAVLVELRGAAVGLLSAAVRLGRLSARRAQVAEHSLASTLLETCAEAVRQPAVAMRSTVPELDVYGLRHAASQVRLFIT